MTNELYIEKSANGFSGGASWRFALESLVQLIAPFAPHTAEELWHMIGHEDSVNKDHWPEWDQALVVEDTITIAVQVNGKVRAELEVAADIEENEAIELAKNNDKIQATLAGGEIKKAIYVRGRLVNLVV